MNNIVCVVPPDAKMSRTDSAGFPLHRGKALNWNQPINFCAKTAKEPLVHICEQCQLPILIYGRMVHKCVVDLGKEGLVVFMTCDGVVGYFQMTIFLET